MDEGHGANVQVRLTICCAPGQCVCRLCPITLRKIRSTMFSTAPSRCRLHHAPCVARGADPTIFAGEGHKIVVPTVTTASEGKAVGIDAAFEVFALGS